MFHQVLERLKLAAAHTQEGVPTSRCIIARRDLHELLDDHQRLDRIVRSNNAAIHERNDSI